MKSEPDLIPRSRRLKFRHIFLAICINEQRNKSDTHAHADGVKVDWIGSKIESEYKQVVSGKPYLMPSLNHYTIHWHFVPVVIAVNMVVVLAADIVVVVIDALK